MAKKKSRKKLIIFTIFGLLIVGGVAWSKLVKRDLPIPISKEKVARRNLTEIVVANGKIQPVLQVKISPEESGRNHALAVKEGQSVKKGDLSLQDQAGQLSGRQQFRRRQLQLFAVANKTPPGEPRKGGSGICPQRSPLQSQARFRLRLPHGQDHL